MSYPVQEFDGNCGLNFFFLWLNEIDKFLHVTLVPKEDRVSFMVNFKLRGSVLNWGAKVQKYRKLKGAKKKNQSWSCMKRMLRFIPLNYCLIPQDMR